MKMEMKEKRKKDYLYYAFNGDSTKKINFFVEEHIYKNNDSAKNWFSPLSADSHFLFKILNNGQANFVKVSADTMRKIVDIYWSGRWQAFVTTNVHTKIAGYETYFVSDKNEEGTEGIENSFIISYTPSSSWLLTIRRTKGDIARKKAFALNHENREVFVDESILLKQDEMDTLMSRIKSIIRNYESYYFDNYVKHCQKN